MAEPPYGIISDQLKAGKVVPFLGAGASMTNRGSEDSIWDHENPKFLPSGSELSKFLAGHSEFPSQEERERNDLAKVASYYVSVSGSSYLREKLHKVLSHEFKPGPLHEYLASIDTPLLIVTTNYDTLLEQAFQAAGKKYDLVIHPPSDKKEIANAIWHWPHGASEPKVEAPNELDLDLDNKDRNPIIYKMHGTVKHDDPQWDSFVITEEDYVDFLSRMTSRTAIPADLYKHFRKRSFLFLGYGLGDWNLRVVLNDLDNKYLKTERYDENNRTVLSWAIQRNPSELEKSLWENRKVKIFDKPLDEFVEKIREKI